MTGFVLQGHKYVGYMYDKNVILMFIFKQQL